MTHYWCDGYYLRAVRLEANNLNFAQVNGFDYAVCETMEEAEQTIFYLAQSGLIGHEEAAILQIQCPIWKFPASVKRIARDKHNTKTQQERIHNMNIWKPKAVGDTLAGIYVGVVEFPFPDSETGEVRDVAACAIMFEETGEVVAAPTAFEVSQTLLTHFEKLKEGETRISIEYRGQENILGGSRRMNLYVIQINGVTVRSKQILTGITAKERLTKMISR